ncbi:MAG TPA: cation:proton antiporter subunit C [Nitrospirae bacterium]|nr:cation:proton antiporter subunit C [Nitrospirota bacterium]
MEYIIAKYNYWMYVILMMVGFYAMIVKKNLVKKLLGLNIFQWAIIFFYISTAVKSGGATVPILHSALDTANINLYLNPLPHVLMLTAIVVGVSTTGVALALVILIYRKFQTLDEDEILDKLRELSGK